LGDLDVEGKIILKSILKEQSVRVRFHSAGSGQGAVANSYEDSNELLGPIIAEISSLSEQLSAFQERLYSMELLNVNNSR
jgi:hypothetical protein